MSPLDVCAAVVFRGGKMLLATRAPGSHCAGLWEFPGGKVEPGEGLGDCIVRELREELSFDVLAGGELFALRQPRPDKGDLLLHFLHCWPLAEEEPLPQDGQRCGWFSPEEWGMLSLAPLDLEFLRAHRRELTDLAAKAR